MNSRLLASFTFSLQVLGCQSALGQNAMNLPMEVVRISNPDLSVEGSGSVTLFRINPQYTLQNVQGGSRTELSLGGLIERSNDTSLSANRTLPNVRVLWESSSPVVVQSVHASLEEESTRETEFVELGKVILDSTRRTGTIGGKLIRQVSAESTLEMAVSHARVSYNAPLLVDYSETRGSVAYGFQSSAVARHSFTASVEGMNPDGAHVNASRVGLVLGREMDVSDRVTLGTTVGAAWTSSPRRTTDLLASLRLVHEGERIDYSVAWSRDVRSSGSVGGYVRSQNFDASATIPFSSNNTLSLGVGHAMSLEADREAGATAYARFRSELTRFWALTMGLEHRQSLPSGRPSARSSAVNLGLVYAHPDF